MADAANQTAREVMEEKHLEVEEESHIELRRIRRLLFLLLLLAMFTAVYFARAVLLPVMIAVVLTLTLVPVVRLGNRLKIPSGVTAVTLIVLVGLAIATGGYFLSGPVRGLVEDAPAMAERVQERMSGVIDRLRDIEQQAEEATGGGAAAAAAEEAVAVDSDGDGAPETEVVAVVEESGPSMTTTVLSGIASIGSTIFAALLLTGFLLAAGDFYHRRIVEAAPRLRDKKKALTIIRDVERQISRYLGSITLINMGLGIAVGLTMWLFGMPTPVLWGILAFLLNYIPFIGAIVGVALAGVVGLVTFDDPLTGLLPALVYFGINSFEGNVVTPTLVGRRLEINTVAMLLAVAFWMWIWGIAGAVLAVPFLVVVKAIADNVESLQTLSKFLSAEPTEGHEDNPPQKATTGPALETAPLRTQAYAREHSPPAHAAGEKDEAPVAAQ